MKVIFWKVDRGAAGLRWRASVTAGIFLFFFAPAVRAEEKFGPVTPELQDFAEVLCQGPGVGTIYPRNLDGSGTDRIICQAPLDAQGARATKNALRFTRITWGGKATDSWRKDSLGNILSKDLQPVTVVNLKDRTFKDASRAAALQRLEQMEKNHTPGEFRAEPRPRAVEVATSGSAYPFDAKVSADLGAAAPSPLPPAPPARAALRQPDEAVGSAAKKYQRAVKSESSKFFCAKDESSKSLYPRLKNQMNQGIKAAEKFQAQAKILLAVLNNLKEKNARSCDSYCDELRKKLISVAAEGFGNDLNRAAAQGKSGYTLARVRATVLGNLKTLVDFSGGEGKLSPSMPENLEIRKAASALVAAAYNYITVDINQLKPSRDCYNNSYHREQTDIPSGPDPKCYRFCIAHEKILAYPRLKDQCTEVCSLPLAAGTGQPTGENFTGGAQAAASDRAATGKVTNIGGASAPDATPNASGATVGH